MRVHAADAVAGYIVDVVRATREQPGLALVPRCELRWH